MTLKEKFENIEFAFPANESVKIADDYAIEFAEFLRKKCLIDDNYLYWWYYGIKYTERELLEIFKKEKGL
jgi:hypothetical protein